MSNNHVKLYFICPTLAGNMAQALYFEWYSFRASQNFALDLGSWWLSVVPDLDLNAMGNDHIKL